MPDGLLGVLKLCLLALLYLFFVRVLWAVASELRGPKAAPLVVVPETPPTPAEVAGATGRWGRRGRGDAASATVVGRYPTVLAVVKGGAFGTIYEVGSELTIGRAPGCAITIDDGFASHLHARVAVDESGALRIEDLGSTNGTFVNGERLVAPRPIAFGDRIAVGNTELEAR
jgi:hypothetical protein